MPCHIIHAGRRVTLECVVVGCKQLYRDMMHEVGETEVPVPFLRSLRYVVEVHVVLFGTFFDTMPMSDCSGSVRLAAARA